MKNFSRYLAIIGLFLLIAGALGLGIAPMFKGFYVLPWAAAFICLLVYSIYNRTEIKSFLSTRGFRYGLGSAVASVIVIAIVVFLAIMSTTHSRRFDMTDNKRYSLAPQTIKILNNLQQDVKVTGFFQSEGPQRQKAKDLFEEYARNTSRFAFKIVDPDRNPAQAKSAGITQYDTIVLEAGDRSEKLEAISEEKLTNGILKVTRPDRKTVYFLTGHGEKNLENIDEHGYSTVKKELENKNYQVKPLLLMQTGDVPEDAAVIVAAGPEKDLLQEELDSLEKYLKDGGRALMMLDPETAPETAAFLKRFRVKIGDDYVVDKMSRLFGGDYLMPLVAEYTQHPVTDGFNVASFFPLSRSVSITEDDVEGVEAVPLARTGKDAWAETDIKTLMTGKAVMNEGDDQAGPVSIAIVGTVKVKKIEEKNLSETDSAKALIEKTENPEAPVSEVVNKEGKFIVFGDSDFASNNYFNLQGNGDLFLNSISWLAEEGDLIAIRAKEPKSQPLMLSAMEARLVFWLPVVVLPLAVVITGFTVLTSRRRRQ